MPGPDPVDMLVKEAIRLLKILPVMLPVIPIPYTTVFAIDALDAVKL
jgi:hypothetical protein